MGWLSAAGSVIGSLFSPSEGKTTGGELLKDMSDGVDAMFYTKEESVRDELTVLGFKQQAFDSWVRINETLKGSEANRSVTRRLLAIGLTLFIICLISVCLISEAISIYQGTPRVKVPVPWAPTMTTELSPMTIAILVISTTFSLGTAFVCIIGFYFGPPILNAMRGK